MEDHGALDPAVLGAVTIGGLRIAPGDLIHADKHGVLSGAAGAVTQSGLP